MYNKKCILVNKYWIKFMKISLKNNQFLLYNIYDLNVDYLRADIVTFVIYLYVIYTYEDVHYVKSRRLYF